MNEVVMKVIGNYTYNTKDCLGEGVYGKVFVGYDIDSRQKVAIKKIDITSYSHDNYLQSSIFYQIFLLKNLSHPNIVKFKDVLTTKNSLYIITEFCKHGDLKEMLKRRRFKEEEGFEVIRQIVNGFSELVKEHIIHRDLKPANILINDGVCKIGDFGFAKYVENMYNHMLKTCVGSPIYMSPQLLEHTHYTTKADIWSIGVIAFEIFFNSPPWKARSEAELLNNIRTIPITTVIGKESVRISGVAVDFLKRLLAYHEKDRISWEELFGFFGIERPVEGGKGLRMEQGKVRPNQVNTINIVGNQRVSLNGNTSGGGGGGGGGGSNGDGNYRMSFGGEKPSHYPGQNNYYVQQNQNNVYIPPPSLIQPPSQISSSIPVSQPPAQQQQSVISQPPQQPQSILPPQPHHHHHLKSLPLLHKSSILSSQQLKILRQECIYKHFVGVELQTNYPLIQSILGDTRKFDRTLLLLAGSNKLKSTYALSILRGKKVLMSQKQLEDFSRLIEKEKELYELFEKEITKLLDKKGILKSLKEEIVPRLTSVEGGEARIYKAEELLLDSSIEISRVLFVGLKQKVQMYAEGVTLVRILDYLLDVINLALQKGFEYNIVELLVVPTRGDEFDVYEYLGKVVARGEQMGVLVGQ